MTGTPDLHLWLIPLLPFAGFLANGLLGRRFPNPIVSLIALMSTGGSFLLALNAAAHFSSLTIPYTERFAPWIQAGAFRADFAFSLDQLTLVMLLIVTGVGFLIHIYSIGYMAHEEGFWRFFAYLNLFMFFMLTLVLSENFLLLFVGWEGVGLASYLLIGFYFTKTSAANAGKKAFVVNRIGDFGFLLAMFLTFAHFGTLSFQPVFAQIAAHPEYQGGFLTAIALFLVLGATGKSAQIPLYIWLPDAMEGPTPVSALIHAATMVTAGVYMTARCHAIFDRSPLALSVVGIIGAATCIFAATMGMVQTDIKRVLAYSTISQLGYMFLACGVMAYSAGIFHLLTHAFFKALLFLSAGSVIHALDGEQDMRVMGGLRKKIPITFWCMTAGVVAISGIPPFAGFVSKDEILSKAFFAPGLGPLLWFVGLRHRRADGVLYVPPLVHDLLWRTSCRRTSARRRRFDVRSAPQARNPRQRRHDALPARGACRSLSRRRVDWLAQRPWRKQSLGTLPRSGRQRRGNNPGSRSKQHHRGRVDGHLDSRRRRGMVCCSRHVFQQTRIARQTCHAVQCDL